LQAVSLYNGNQGRRLSHADHGLYERELGIPLVVFSQRDKVSGNPKWATAIKDDANNFFTIRHEGEETFIDIEKRWGLQRGTGELRDLAVKLFGQPSQDRAAVIAKYMDVLKKPGSAAKGQAVFGSICIACHKYKGQGVDVGPDITDIKAKPPEALLSDILDPNRMFEARWCAYQIDTKDGRSLSGIVGSESQDSVVLKMMGGIAETIQRSNIKLMKSLDRSLMPVGLESAVNQEQMADLLAFLLGR
jgi:putative heme-binding domain-containing protein